MSSSGSDTEHSSFSDLSEYEICEYEETPNPKRRRQLSDGENDQEYEDGYRDEPLADEQWIADYNERERATAELESELTKRLNGEVPVGEWCKCGNCETSRLQNISECYCCTELDGCMEALTSDFVTQDLSPGVILACVTEHPGFQPVCLQKWSLRMAGDKFKTKDKKRYRQTGSEERFLRSVAYREFSRLIYGMLGSKRIPLPACAYTAVRQAFSVNDRDDSYTGFDLDED